MTDDRKWTPDELDHILSSWDGQAFGPHDHILGPILDVTTTATEEQKLELLAEIDRRREISRLERENAIMRQALRKSQHYLGRYLEPGNLSATECINGLLKTLDNDEINEVTKR